MHLPSLVLYSSKLSHISTAIAFRHPRLSHYSTCTLTGKDTSEVMQTRMHARLHTTCTHACTHSSTEVCKHARIHVPTHVHMRVCVHTKQHLCTHTRIDACTHARARTHMHACMHESAHAASMTLTPTSDQGCFVNPEAFDCGCMATMKRNCRCVHISMRVLDLCVLVCLK